MRGSRTRERHKGEASYPVGLPEAPAFIEADALARQKWLEIGARLVSVKVLTTAHGEMLALLCSAWADLDRARVEFAEGGYRQVVPETRITASGHKVTTVKANPLVLRIEKLSYQVARYLGEFGLTPMTATKAKANGGGAGAGDPWAEFFGEKH
jgi:hypothetical protein